LFSVLPVLVLKCYSTLLVSVAFAVKERASARGDDLDEEAAAEALLDEKESEAGEAGAGIPDCPEDPGATAVYAAQQEQQRLQIIEQH
jgi:hypothetical protein